MELPNPPLFQRDHVAHTRIESPEYKGRMQTARPQAERDSWLHCAGFCMYVPVYVGGPTTTFNAWCSYVVAPQQAMDLRSVAVYIVRWVALWVHWELMCHWTPVFAVVGHHLFLRPGVPVYVKMVVVYWNLHFLWSKFTLIWRFCRMWAVCDGVEVPENQLRCVHNNFSIPGFWRGWHRSFNIWLLRYLYIPLGGNRVAVWRQLLSVGLVFMFVAVWHDFNIKLIKWGWLFILFFAPEMAAVAWSNTAGARAWYGAASYRALVAAGAALNIVMLIVGNFVGYGAGSAGKAVGPLLWSLLFDDQGNFQWMCWLVAAGMLFSAAQLQLFARAREDGLQIGHPARKQAA